jgi:hypothetical protein
MPLASKAAIETVRNSRNLVIETFSRGIEQ